MNIAEILKYCPKGTKLYSTAFGDVVLDEVCSETNKYPIKIQDYTGLQHVLTEHGYYSYNIPNSECILFPSKDQRDWNKFRLPVKRGDIMMLTDGTMPFIASGEYYWNTSPKYICGINSNAHFVIGTYGWTSDFYIPASEEAKKKLFDKMEEAGYKWNVNTLELEKIPKFKEGDVIIDKKGSIFLISRILDVGGTLEMAAVLNKEGLIINPNVWQNPYDKSIASKEDRNKLFSVITKEGYRYDKELHTLIKQDFKPFDKVLVRDSKNEEWSINIFSYYDEENKNYPYVCLCNRYNKCIPYENNEYLVGKTSNIH